MEIELDIVRNADCAENDDFFRMVAKETVSRCGIPSLSVSSRVTLGAAFVDEDAIRALNLEYRGKDVPTDVLSFSEHEGETVRPGADGTVFLGDLVISPEFVRRAASGDGVPFRRELAYVFSHGVLHLLGFDHSEEMFSVQDAVTDAVAGGGAPVSGVE